MGCVFATLTVGGVPDFLGKSDIEELGPVIGNLIEMALPVSVWSMAVVATDITPTTTGSPTPAPTPKPTSQTTPKGNADGAETCRMSFGLSILVSVLLLVGTMRSM